MDRDLSYLHPDVQEFIARLRAIEQLLAADYEQFWRGRIQNIIEIARESDGRSVEIFLGMFGGMGSFGDFILSESGAKNSALRAAQNHAYEFALKLR